MNQAQASQRFEACFMDAHKARAVKNFKADNAKAAIRWANDYAKAPWKSCAEWFVELEGLPLFWVMRVEPK